MSGEKSLGARLRHRLFHTYFRFQRPVTLGVRAAIIDADNRLFLVRHGYVPGWHMPGGGVENGQSVLDALRQEALEEGLIRIMGTPPLHGMYFNRRASPRDHVALFVVRDFEITGQRKPNYEIAETGWFPIDQLPEGTTRSTRQRIAEVFFDEPLSEEW
jgi:ADP-ribose pyrophosphatase YjhB (NUDIX family)